MSETTAFCKEQVDNETDFDYEDYGYRVQMLMKIAVIHQYRDDIDDHYIGKRFKLKYTDMERETLDNLRMNEIIEEVDTGMGNEKTWRFTGDGEYLIEIHDATNTSVPVLRPNEVAYIERNSDVFEVLPDDTSTEFRAKDIDALSDGHIATLSRMGFVRKVHDQTNEPTIWKMRHKGALVHRFLFDFDEPAE